MRTRSRTLPTLLAASVVLAAGALFMAVAGGEGEPLPNAASRRCRDKVAEVEYGADMGSKARPVKIRHWRQGKPPVSYDLTTDWWTAIDQVVPCPAVVRLTVSSGDVWGGDTECWISVDGTRVVEARTRLRAVCSVTVKLVA